MATGLIIGRYPAEPQPFGIGRWDD